MPDDLDDPNTPVKYKMQLAVKLNDDGSCTLEIRDMDPAAIELLFRDPFVNTIEKMVWISATGDGLEELNSDD